MHSRLNWNFHRRAAEAIWCAAALLALIFPTSSSAQNSQPSLLDKAIARSSDEKSENTRIVGGSKATIAANAWQVALVWSGSKDNVRAQFCGGAILAPGWIVTAAHCIDKDKSPAAYEVLSGTESLATGGVRSKVVEYIVHDDYRTSADEKIKYSDIALIKIDATGQKVAGSAIRGLPAPQVASSTGMVRVTGWGVTQNPHQATIALQYVDMPYVETKICNAKKSYDGAITESMLCLGEELGGKDSCQGDSGGPASVEAAGVRYLIGIVSWGEGCGDPDMYGVYTRVSSFRDWIRTKTANAVVW